ncbi:cellobiohydrolaseI [Pleurotus eryngii]|uniref:Glucanase n=1 Tax=Pleurotus eryngii TaxID=5323 RepID=A0A9P5ZIX9_PLEER|nr:cellobiohydrolaseI [Pleurotus eryngii]
MFRSAALVAFTFAAVVLGQQVGTLIAETHPTSQVSQCTAAGQCTAQSKLVVLDSNWRWLHDGKSFSNCYDGNTWHSILFSSPTTCASNCALDGADYSGTYGITTSGNALTLKFVTKGQYSTNIGSRHYKMFNLKKQEFFFDVDMSQLPCDGANGRMSKNTGNKAGAKLGTGYRDSQCPHDIKFINGEVSGSPNDANAGTGRYGACCSEMDIWEANSMASAYTPHPCSVTGIRRCSGTECGDGDNRYGGVCDKDGCDLNSFRMGDKNFLGKGKTIDTTKKITVVTQFVTDNCFATGTLSEIRRIYVQNEDAFGDTNSFASKGGLAKMGDAFANGMILIMSVWDDHAANILWPDSNYPATKSASTPCVARGECATTSGVPADVESQSPNAQVTFSNIRTGPIGSTYTGSTGIGYTGPTFCASGSTCTKLNEYYSQCL